MSLILWKMLVEKTIFWENIVAIVPLSKRVNTTLIWPANFDVTQHGEVDQHCGDLAQEEGEQRDERKKYNDSKKNKALAIQCLVLNCQEKCWRHFKQEKQRL